jgi:hypothetical protein
MEIYLVVKKLLVQICFLSKGPGNLFEIFKTRISFIDGYFERYDGKKENWIYFKWKIGPFRGKRRKQQ